MNLRKQLSSYIALNNYVEAIKSGQLPTGYTELEYIESSGTQHINTGVVLGQDYTNTNIKLEYDALINDGATWQVCGTLGSNGIYIGVNYSDIIWYGAGGGDVSTGVTNPFVKCKYINDAKNGVIKVTNLSTNTDIVNLTYSPVTKTTVLPMILFGFSTSATVINQQKMSGKMYNAKIYNNNELIRHFIPVKRNSDNVLGMYDTISGTFFTNSGTGSFVAGPEVYNSSIVLTDAITNGLTDLQLKGGTEQNGTPTPDTPIDITSNNGVLKVSPNLFDKNASYALFNGYINNTSVGQNTTLMDYSGGDKTIKVKVAPNTTYTVTRATNLGSVYDRIRCAAFTTLPSSGSTGVILCNYMNKTQANATFTTLSDTQYVAINVRNSGAVGDDWTQFVDAFQLEKGSTATQYRPYGQIYTDGTVETITITGKNLFNESHIKSVAINDISVVIPVKQNKTYTWSYNKTEYDFRFDSDFVWGIDLNGSKVENGVTLVYANGTYTTASYVTVTIVSPNVVALQTIFRNNVIQPTRENVLASSMQLEEGIRPTKYEEYYQVSFAPEDLLKLSDYQDVQSVLDGVVTRNVGIKVLDGTENWTRYGTGKFAMPLIGSKKQDSQEVPFATHFIGMSLNNVPVKDGYVSVFNGSIAPTSGALGINYQATPEVAEFKQWLADQYANGTPVIVVYPLADTVEETVESRDVFITSGTNTIERNSEYVSSDGMTVKYKKLR